MIYRIFVTFFLILILGAQIQSSYSQYHDIADCFDISTIDVDNVYTLYPYDSQANKYELSATLGAIYFDETNNKFYSDKSLSRFPGVKNLEKITNRCVYLYGDRFERNQTDNFQIGLEIASANNAYFYLERNLYLNKTVHLKSNVTLIGIDNYNQKAQIGAYQNSVSYLLSVYEGANNIELRNLKILESQQIEQAFVIFSGNNEDIQIKSVDFIGTDISPDNRTRALFFSGESQKDILIRDSLFQEIEYGVHVYSPVEGLQVTNNIFTQWTHYALLVNISGQITNGQSKDIEIRHNSFKHASEGGDRGVVLISPGKSVRYVTNVEITSNIVEGNGGSFIPKNLDTDYENNNAHGDQIVLHRVNNFLISNNNISKGGENGITASRLSRNGRISNNDVYDNDGNGFSIGSGYFELHLDSVVNLEVGDRIIGNATNSEATITYIYPGYNIVGVERINASPSVITSPTFGNEEITIERGDTTFTRNITVVDRTKQIDILENRIYSNGHNSANEHADGIFSGVYVIHSDSINFRRNTFYNGASTIVQKWAITASRSRNLSRDGTNTSEGAPLTSSSIQLQALSWMID